MKKITTLLGALVLMIGFVACDKNTPVGPSQPSQPSIEKPVVSDPPVTTPTTTLAPGNDKTTNEPRDYWYPNQVLIYGEYNLVIAAVANNTDKVQSVGLAVYKSHADGSVSLYYAQYGQIAPIASLPGWADPYLHYFGYVPPDCPYSVFLSAIGVPFDPYVPNVNTDGYLIFAQSGNTDKVCPT